MTDNGDEKTRFPVWFNKDAKTLHEQLVTDGITSQAFIDFVKNAFHDKVDALRFKANQEKNKEANQ